MNPFFAEIVRQVQAKAPEACARMAVAIETGDLPPEQRDASSTFFTFIAVATPPPSHPSNPTALSMRFDVTGEWLEGGKMTLWLGNDGTPTDNPTEAREVPSSYRYVTGLAAELRTKAFEGVRHIREAIIQQGVPRSHIRDNCPRT